MALRVQKLHKALAAKRQILLIPKPYDHTPAGRARTACLEIAAAAVLRIVAEADLNAGVVEFEERLLFAFLLHPCAQAVGTHVFRDRDHGAADRQIGFQNVILKSN